MELKLQLDAASIGVVYGKGMALKSVPCRNGSARCCTIAVEGLVVSVILGSNFPLVSTHGIPVPCAGAVPSVRLLL